MPRQNEKSFRQILIHELKSLFPGCVVLENDPSRIQGIPDLVVLWKKKWAALECKASATAHHRPNQDYYIDLMKKMSFASFIYPANKEQVLDDLQLAFRPSRTARVSRPKQVSLDQLYS